MKKFLRSLKVTFIVSVFLLVSIAQAEDNVLNIYNWSDYIGETTISQFEAETGIKVRYDTFDSNEILEAKLLSGNSGYDIVVPSGSFLERQIKAGIFSEIDKSKLSRYNNLDVEILKAVEKHDSGNTHSVPWMWGTVGIGYNEAALKERLGDIELNSLDLIFKPEVVSKLADCGVALLDSPSEVMSVALHYLGLDPNSEDKGDLDKATELMISIRPHIKYFQSSQYINDLANGEICIAIGYNGDVSIAAARAEEAGGENIVTYIIPKEGAPVWFDVLGIPADAKNKDNAHKFIDFILKPEVIAEVSNYVFYANPNTAATGLIDEAVTSDPGIYPPEDVKANLFPLLAHTQKFDRLLTRAWTKIKTNK